MHISLMMFTITCYSSSVTSCMPCKRGQNPHILVFKTLHHHFLHNTYQNNCGHQLAIFGKKYTQTQHTTLFFPAFSSHTLFWFTLEKYSITFNQILHNIDIQTFEKFSTNMSYTCISLQARCWVPFCLFKLNTSPTLRNILTWRQMYMGKLEFYHPWVCQNMAEF